MSKSHISHEQQQINLSKIKPGGLDVEEEADRDDVQPLKQLLIMDHDHEEQEPIKCVTPTSSDHKLPSIRSCPSTPRKPNKGRVVCLQQKRKLSDLHFFETTRREEVDSFFRSIFDFSSTARVKKRSMSI